MPEIRNGRVALLPLVAARGRRFNRGVINFSAVSADQPMRPCARSSFLPSSVTITISPKPAMVSRAT